MHTRCDIDANHSRAAEHRLPPRSSRTLAWFTAAPAPTRALAASTWLFTLAAYSGVQPSVCRTTHRDSPHDDGPHLTRNHTSTRPVQNIRTRHDYIHCMSITVPKAMHNPQRSTCTQSYTHAATHHQRTTKQEQSASCHAPMLGSPPRRPQPGPSPPPRGHWH